MWLEQKDEDKDQSQQTNTLGNQSVGAGAGSAPTIQSSTTPSTGNPSRMNPEPATPGQQFGTIQDYFKANKDQGERLGEQFTAKLDTEKQQQQQQIGQAADVAKGQVAQNVIGFDEGLVSQAAKDPTKVAGDEAQYNKFMQQWGAEYKGPQSFEQTSAYDQAAKAAQAAKSKAEQVETVGGRQQAIQDEFKVYGQGNKGLDEALLQQSSSFGKVGQKANELRSLQDYLGTKSKEVGTEAQKARATTEQTRQKAQDALLGEQGAVKQFQQDITTRTQQEQAKAKKDIADIQAAVAGRAALSDQQLQMLGINRDQYQNLVDKENQAGYSNLQNYLRAQNPEAQISREAVAKTGDFEKDKALAKLTGRGKMLGDARQAGKLLDFDKDTALQAYLDKIGADEATREQARLEREAQIRAQEEEKLAQEKARTEKRELTQDILGNTIIPGGKFLTEPIVDVLKKDKLGSGVVDHIKDNYQKPLENYLKDPKKELSREVENVKELVKNPVKKVEQTVNKVANSIKKAFCFDGETMIDMADGSSKAIKDIQLGDETKGGVVESIRQSIAVEGTRYNYRNIIVTGSHAVKENKWRRVQDSKYARPIEGEGKVYSLVTSDYRIFINSLEFADEHETPFYEQISMEESLRYLNRQEELVGAEHE